MSADVLTHPQWLYAQFGSPQNPSQANRGAPEHDGLDLPMQALEGYKAQDGQADGEDIRHQMSAMA